MQKCGVLETSAHPFPCLKTGKLKLHAKKCTLLPDKGSEGISDKVYFQTSVVPPVTSDLFSSGDIKTSSWYVFLVPKDGFILRESVIIIFLPKMT